MSKHRTRLDPDEVKRSLAAEKAAAEPPEPFHTPFAAARERLEKLAPTEPPGPPDARARRRNAREPTEPSQLAQVRASRRAARDALAKAVAPIRRSPPKGEPR